MANMEQVEALRQGIHVWEEWRRANPGHLEVDLSGADLKGVSLQYVRLPSANLRGADLSGANLRDSGFRHADFSGAILRETDFSQANLVFVNFRHCNLAGSDLRRTNLSYACFEGASLKWANLPKADLWGANFIQANLEHAFLELAHLNQANLTGANLRYAKLFRARLDQAILEGADLTEAYLEETDFCEAVLAGADFSRTVICKTIFGNVDLSQVKGLDTAWYVGHSFVDIHTLHRSQGTLSRRFLQGVGLPDSALTYAQAQDVLNSPTSRCFLLYDAHDQMFVEQLVTDLQAHGTRCWPIVCQQAHPKDPSNPDPSEKIFSHIQSHPNCWMVDEMVQAPEKLVVVVSQEPSFANLVRIGHTLTEEQRVQRQILIPLYTDQDLWEKRYTMPKLAQFALRRVSSPQPEGTERLTFDFSQWRDPEKYQEALRAFIDIIIS